ncbi:MAG: RNA polymerase sigma factor [Akkermansiaceae bacterium]
MSAKNQKSDVELLVEFADTQSNKAFTTLVGRYGAVVFSVSNRVLSNHHDAEEVTQAVFLQLAKHAGKLAGRPYIASWLHTVAYRFSLNMHKSRKVRSLKEQESMNEFDLTVQESKTVSNFREHLDEAVQKLPDRYRQPFILFHLQGASLNEISDTLSLNPSTLRNRLARARETLRRHLNRKGLGITSVAALSALLTTKLEAATLPASLAAVLTGKSFTSGVSASASVLSLVSQAGSMNHSLFNLTQLYILMKTQKTVILVATAVSILGTSAVIAVNHHKNKESADGNQITDSAHSSKNKDGKRPAQRDRPKRANVNPADQGIPRELLEARDEYHKAMEKAYAYDKKHGTFFEEPKGLAELQRAGSKAYGRFESLVEKYADTNPERATKFLLASFYKGMSAVSTLTTFAQKWAVKDPNAALAWALKIDDVNNKSYLLDGILPVWHQKNPKVDPTNYWESWLVSGMISYSGTYHPASKILKNYSDVTGDYTATANLVMKRMRIEDNKDEEKKLRAKVITEEMAEKTKELQRLETKYKELVEKGEIDLAEELKKSARPLMLEMAELSKIKLREIGARMNEPMKGLSRPLRVTVETTVMPQFINIWVKKEGVDKVAQWAEKIPGGQTRDSILQTMSSNLMARNDAEAAVNLVEKIADKKIRADAFNSLIHKGLKKADGPDQQFLLSLSKKVPTVRFSTLKMWHTMAKMNAEPAAMDVFESLVKQAHADGKFALDDNNFYDNGKHIIKKDSVYAYVQKIIAKDE